MMKIKNWRKFQHFKDRRPPWIKLHREMLEQRDISAISDCSFRVLIGLYLLASEDEKMEGNLPAVEDIAFRLRMNESKIRTAIQELTPWVERDDIDVISEQYQVGPPETEAYKEEEEKEDRGRDIVIVEQKPLDLVRQVIEYLNQAAGKSYKPGSADAKKYIPARAKEGYELDDFKAAVDNQVREWHGTEMEKFLRPSTLFNSDKFGGYVNNTGSNRTISRREQVNRGAVDGFLDSLEEGGAL